jgi:hypothetical protein
MLRAYSYLGWLTISVRSSAATVIHSGTHSKGVRSVGNVTSSLSMAGPLKSSSSACPHPAIHVYPRRRLTLIIASFFISNNVTFAEAWRSLRRFAFFLTIFWAAHSHSSFPRFTNSEPPFIVRGEC